MTHKSVDILNVDATICGGVTEWRRIAAMANLSPSHFKTLFRQHVGYACIDYFIRLRIHHACQLLDTTDASAKHVASQVGYADPLWFSKAFRAVTGMPPSEYRRKHKG